MQKENRIVAGDLDAKGKVGLNITDSNKKYRDNGGKVIFGDNILCAQFLKDYVPVSILKEVQPEDIEDVSERYVPLFTSERESDIVKKIHLKDERVTVQPSILKPIFLL